MAGRRREFRLRDATGTVLAVVPGTLSEALKTARGFGYAVQDFVVPDSIIVRGDLPRGDLPDSRGPAAAS